MPASSIKDLPKAFEKESDAVKKAALPIFNALLKDGMDEGRAIAIALSKARKMVSGVKESEDDDVEECYSDKLQFEKTDKKVNYRAAGEKDEKCCDCRFYRWGQCSIVEGHIESSYTCDLWEEKLPSQKPMEVHEAADQAAEIEESTEEIEEAMWSTAMMNDLPDECFLYIEPGGKKDADGKTTPRSLRHFPYKDASGKIDMPHLRNAIARIPQADIPEDKKKTLQAKARAMLQKAKGGSMGGSMKEEVIQPMPRVNGHSPEQEKNFKLSEHLSLVEAVGDSGTVWEVRCIKPGLSLNHTYYSDDVLKEAVKLFQGVPCFADHRDGPRSVKDLVGWFETPTFIAGSGIHAQFNALESADWFLGPLKEAYERGKTDLIGFSINGEGSRHMDRVDGHAAFVVDSIRVIESVDGVIAPSAGGQVVKLVASQAGEEEDTLMDRIEDMSLEDLRRVRPDLAEAMQAELDAAKEKAQTDFAAQLEVVKEQQDKEAEAARKADEDAKLREQEEKNKTEEDKTEDRINEIQQKTEETLAALQEQLAKGQCSTKLQERMATTEVAGLPQVMRDSLLRQFSGRVFTDEELDTAVTGHQETLKGLQDERPESLPRIEIGEDARDKAIKALDGLLRGEDVDGVPAARTLKEAYATFKGIPTWGQIDAAEVLRECWAPSLTEGSSRLRETIASTTWAEVMSDRIHKRMIQIWQLPYLNDWRRVASSVVGIPDFKTQRRVNIGGYANYASVAEAGSYVTVASPGDDESTYSVKKYGGLERLTIEAIANDDVGAVRRIPELLARGGKQTLYETVLDLLRTNPQVSWTTNVSVFDSNNATNVVTSGTDDAALNDANLSKAKRLLTEMVGRDNATSGSKPLGLRASLLLIPPELEATAMRLRENEFAMTLSGGAEGTVTAAGRNNRDINVHRNSFEYLVVPYWTDSDRWVVLTDPATHPLIEVGFYLGRQEPELFVQDLPNVGTMFDSDQLTYKARLIFGSVVLDNRGMIASSEATA